MTATDALKPCPFCGNPAELENEVIQFPNSRNKFYAVKCITEDCPAANIAQDGEMGGFFYSWTKDEAITKWNERSGKDVIESLEKLAERWEKIAERVGVRQFTGNDHLLFANELRVIIERNKL